MGTIPSITIHLHFANGQGGGGQRLIESGTTVGELFEEVVGGSFGDSTVRVTGETVTDPDRELVEGDVVTFAPRKVTGAN